MVIGSEERRAAPDKKRICLKLLTGREEMKEHEREREEGEERDDERLGSVYRDGQAKENLHGELMDKDFRSVLFVLS